MESYIPSGTYVVFEGLMSLSNSDIQRVRRIATSGQEKPNSAQKAVQEIAELLPPDSAAAVKQLGSSPVSILFIILYLISVISTTAAGVGTAYETFFPSDPAPQTIINNNVTVNNYGTSSHDGESEVSKGPNRRERRKQEKMARQKKYVQGEEKSKTTDDGSH